MAQAEREGYQVELVLENGSGRNENRPKLKEALDLLNGGKAAALFVVDTDRLARSARHLLEVVECAKRKGWRLVIGSLNIDTATSSGKMQIGMLAVFAEFESDLISERVKRQHQARRERGIVWGVDQGFKGNLNPKARALIMKRHQEGVSLRKIASELEAKGLETPRGGAWLPASVLSVIRSPQSKVLVKE
jgi:DNA invertase Pin-like site-specific DNA recombinase